MARAIYGLIRRVKIQRRLALSFAIFSLIPLLITGWYAYHKSSVAIKNKISTYSVQVMNQVSINIQNELTKLEIDSVDIAFSDTVQNILLDYHKMDNWEKNSAEVRINNLVAKRFSFVPSVTDVQLFTDEKKQINAYGDFTFRFRLKSDYLDRLLSESLRRGGKPVWTIHSTEQAADWQDASYRADVYGEPGILLSRSFGSLKRGNTLGYILMRMNESFILSKYKDIDLGEGSEIFIVDESGLVISSRNPAIQKASHYPEPSLIENIQQHQEEKVFSFRQTIAGTPYLVTYSPIPTANWYLVSTIPFSYLNDEAVTIGLSIALLGIVCFMLALILSILVSKSISKPLHTLITSMNQAKSGKFPTLIDDSSQDELGVVAGHFNKMVHDLKFLVSELKKNEKLKREAELNALQSQINPHFLYNTLNNIRWLAKLQKADNISNVIYSLIQLLRASMWRVGELVTIEEEMEYVQHYLNIMKYRYYDKFEVHFQVEEEVLQHRTLKFMLQPIVENAISHGIAPLEGQGLIVIKSYRIDDRIKISVTDNGVGMSEGQLSKVMPAEGKANPADSKNVRMSGIGIRNVDQRIKLYFGDEYGVSIQSVPGLFTTIELTIPVLDKEGKA